MYTTFYNLKEKAFSKTPDPGFLYLNESYEEAIMQLLYAVEEREMGVLIGSVGSGKTLLTRVLIDRLDDTHEVAVIINPRLTPAQFVRTIAYELGIKAPRYFKSDLVGQIQDRLFDLDDEGRTAVLIVDEAQLIPKKAVFDEIRLLTNFQLDDRNLIAVILVGQPELKKRLLHHSYRAFTQRIGAEFELEPLTAEDTRHYIEHRLDVAAGCRGTEIFNESAVQVIHEASSGIPRVINHLATQCLLEGFSKEIDKISGPLVERVIGSLMFLPKIS